MNPDPLDQFADALKRFGDDLTVALITDEAFTRPLLDAVNHDPARDFEAYPDSDYGHPVNMT